jgi:hypothetical protein
MKKATQLDEIQRNFSPTPLTGKDLDLEEGIYVDTIEARTNDAFNSPIRKIYNACIGESFNFIQVLMGHRGCGKSTEINKLEQKFNAEGYIVKKIDCVVETNLSKIDVFDIIYIILQSLIDIAQKCKVEGVDENNEYIIRALNYFNDTDIIKKVEEENSDSFEAGSGFGFDKIISIFAKGKTAIQYNTETITTIKERIKKSNEDWFNCIDFLCDAIYAQEKKRPIIIFENFDKIMESSKVLEIFNDGYISSEKIRTYCIFTFPISLTYDTRIGRIEHYFDKFIFPMIEVKKKNRSNNREGIQAIKNIIGKRASLDLFEEGSLDLLIEKTGGSLRDVFSCIREAADRAEFRAERNREVKIITKDDIKKVLLYLKSDITRRIVTGDYPALTEIHNNKMEIEDKEKMLKFLEAHVVLEYNGERWHDCHPLIWDFIEENVNKKKNQS